MNAISRCPAIDSAIRKPVRRNLLAELTECLAVCHALQLAICNLSPVVCLDKWHTEFFKLLAQAWGNDVRRHDDVFVTEHFLDAGCNLAVRHYTHWLCPPCKNNRACS